MSTFQQSTQEGLTTMNGSRDELLKELSIDQMLSMHYDLFTF